ncbi:MAG: DUF433 domain-containing protein [Nostocaceae cyanobacterium]|nr:DUF433 domain-containing protein [Nostocaceae cyanobacterium]
MFNWDAEIYNSPAYPVTDAARYLRIPVGTLRAWFNGRSYVTRKGQQKFEPLIQRPDRKQPEVSFSNLVEAHILRVIRENHQIKLDRVRTALDYLSEVLNTNHPLIQHSFQTDGIDLFIDSMDRLVNVSRSGQLAMRETLKFLLTRIEWDERGIASRLFPLIQTEGDSAKILCIDPRISFGKPIIVGTGIPTASLVDLYEAGEEIENIANEFDCTPDQVRAAIRFESLGLAA